jgi:Tol biopolymer transport system component
MKKYAISISTLIIAPLCFLACLLSCQQSAKKQLVPLATSGAGDTPSTGAAATAIGPLGPPVAVTAGAKSESSLLAKPLTTSGEDTDPSFSLDGQRILFISRLRPNHKQAQVYELHLGVMKEKRLTFHDGEDSSPSYTPDGQSFLFSSATDEIKEDPYVSERMIRTYLPDTFEARIKERGGAAIEGIEVYLQSLNGRSIERLTKSPGFDGDPDIDAKGKHIMFSSSRDSGSTHLYIQNAVKNTRSATRLTDGKVIDRGARFSPDGKSVVWSRQVAEPKSPDTHLMLATSDFKKPLALTSDTGTNFEPAWNPGGDDIVFSSNRAGKYFNLFVVDRAGRCVRRLTEAEFDQFQPAFSPDGKRLVFTGRQDGRHHIYVMDYQKPAPCSTPAAAQPLQQ